MSDVHEALEDLLQDRAAEGREVEEGVFTLSSEKILAKLAEFQLPFKGAWAIKLVQAAVVAGCQSLAIRSTSDETSFDFTALRMWSLADVESAVWQPQLRAAPALRHLAVALWAVGIGARREFRLEVVGEVEALQWTGKELERVPLDGPAARNWLTVKHLCADANVLSSLISKVASAFENAEVLTAIRERCFTCPIPLTLDGRRMDSLQLSPRNGWSNETDLLSLAVCHDEALPAFPLSPQTFALPPAHRVGSSAVEAPDVPRDPCSSCSLAVLVTVNVQLGAKGAHLYKKARSQLYWVQDGVVLVSHPWLGGESFCSLGCVLSAEGIATDLSTLALQTDPALEERANRAAEHCLRLLEENDWEVLHRWADQAASSDRKTAKVMAGAGVLTLPLLPIGLTLLGIGGLVYVLAGTNQMAIRKAITKQLPELVAQVRAAVEGGRPAE